MFFDNHVVEKNEQIKFLKIKLDDLTKKFQVLIEENSLAYNKIESLPVSLKTQMNAIKSQAQLVLEENKVLTKELKLKTDQIVNIEKLHIQEKRRLSRRIMLCECNRVDLLNQIDVLNENMENLKKTNNCSRQAMR